MANRWGNNGNSDRFCFVGVPKSLQMMTEALKLRHLLLGRKAKTNLDNVLKSRDNKLLTKFCIVKALFFPVFMYKWESWTIKKAECHWIYAFELCCWKRLLRVPWTARRSNQSIIKEVNPVTLATWCEEQIHWKRLWCWKRLKAGGEVGNRGWDGWMALLIQWTWIWASSRR